MTVVSRDLNGKLYKAFQTVQNTVSTTALTLEDFGFSAGEVGSARIAEIYVNTNGIRLDPVNAPTVAQGIQLLSTDEMPYVITDRDAISNLRVIRDDAADAEVFIVLKR